MTVHSPLVNADVDHQGRIEVVRLQSGTRSQRNDALLRYIDLLEERADAAVQAQADARSREARIEDAAESAFEYHLLGRADFMWDANEMLARLDALGAALRT